MKTCLDNGRSGEEIGFLFEYCDWPETLDGNKDASDFHSPRKIPLTPPNRIVKRFDKEGGVESLPGPMVPQIRHGMREAQGV